MPYPHAIRLAGPWEFEAQREDGTVARGRIKPPNDVIDAQENGFRGTLRWLRKFGCPTNIDAGERVWLVVSENIFGEVRLNGELLGELRGGSAVESDVTSALKPRNQLVVEVQAGGEAPRSTGDPMHVPSVRLEVRRLWYVSDLAVTENETGAAAAIAIRGEVAGERFAAGELSLLVEGFDRELYFGPVTTSGAFTVTIPAARLPVSRGCDATDLADLNVQLLLGGEAVWESRCSASAADLLREPEGK